MAGKKGRIPVLYIALLVFISVLSGCAVSDYTNHNVTKDFGTNYYLTENITKVVTNFVYNGSTIYITNNITNNITGGTGNVSLANYYNKTEVDGFLVNKSSWNSALHSSDLNSYMEFTDGNNRFYNKTQTVARFNNYTIRNTTNLSIASLKINPSTQPAIIINGGTSDASLLFTANSSNGQKLIDIWDTDDGGGDSSGYIELWGAGIKIGDSFQWSDAYGWGDHAAAGYAKKTELQGNLSNYYTKTVTLARIANTSSLNNYYTKTQTDNNLTARYTSSLELAANLSAYQTIASDASADASAYAYFKNSSMMDFTDEISYWGTSRLEWLGAGFGATAGTAAAYSVSSYANKRGLAYLRDSNAANGGYYVKSVGTSMYFIGGEYFRLDVCLPNTANRANTTFLIGFHDSESGAEPTDGCFFRSINRNVQARCKSGASITSSSNNFTLIQNRCYGFEVSMSSANNNVTFKIYNRTAVLLPGALVYTNSVGSNLPTTASYLFGWGITAYQSTTDAAADLIYLDRVKVRYRT